MPDWVSTLIVAGAPVIAGLGTLWLTNRQQESREGREHERNIRGARRERLRLLYTEAMTMALAVTPRGLQYRFPSDASEHDVPAVNAADADRMRARLMIEPAEDEDAVLQAFVGVVNFSAEYRGEKGSPHTPPDELRKTEKIVRDNVDKLQSLCRQRLAALEK